MNRLTAVLLAVLTASTCLLAEGRRYRVMTYNVENLFDTCHDNGKSDEEFLPGGQRQWNSWRYWKKLGDLARVVAAAGGDEPASLVALCEVENDSVVRDLARRTMLRRLGYEYVVTRGPDARGIDVALLYQPGRFRPLGIRSVRVAYTSRTERPTRDILHVEGLVPFDAFVQRPFQGRRFIAHCYGPELDGAEGKPFLADVLSPGSDALVMVGPEGDFTPDEVRRAMAAGFSPVSLGDSRLRTETAALVAVHLMGLAGRSK